MLETRNENTEGLEVFDEKGTPLGRVNLPSDPGLFGAEKGTVYLDRPIPGLARPGMRPHAA